MKTNCLVLFLFLSLIACKDKNAQQEEVTEIKRPASPFMQALDSIASYSSLKELIAARPEEVKEGIEPTKKVISLNYLKDEEGTWGNIFAKYQENNVIFLMIEARTNHSYTIELTAIDAQTEKELANDDSRLNISGGYSHMGVHADCEASLNTDGSITIKEILSEYNFNTGEQEKPKVSTQTYRFDKAKGGFIVVQ